MVTKKRPTVASLAVQVSQLSHEMELVKLRERIGHLWFREAEELALKSPVLLDLLQQGKWHQESRRIAPRT
jgi:hypothetical protein